MAMVVAIVTDMGMPIIWRALEVKATATLMMSKAPSMKATDVATATVVAIVTDMGMPIIWRALEVKAMATLMMSKAPSMEATDMATVTVMCPLKEEVANDMTMVICLLME